MKYGVTITYSEQAYIEVEADSEEEAIELAAETDESEYETFASDLINYEAELLEEGNKNGT